MSLSLKEFTLDRGQKNDFRVIYSYNHEYTESFLVAKDLTPQDGNETPKIQRLELKSSISSIKNIGKSKYNGKTFT